MDQENHSARRSTARDSANKINTSRRRFLSSCGSIIIAAGSYSRLGSGSSREEVSIPTIISRDGVIQRRTVPREWWNYVKRVRNTRSNIRETHNNDPGVISIHIAQSEATIAGRNKTLVEADINPAEYGGTLPEEANGIPIRTKEAEVGESGSTYGCHNKTTFGDVPGGVVCNNDYTGTTCARGYNTNKGVYEILTAAHLFDACSKGGSAIVGDEELFQDGQDAGLAWTINVEEDWVGIKDDSADVNYSGDLNTEQDGNIELQGAVTNLEYHMDNGTTFHQQGVETGQTSGDLIAIDVSSNVSSGDSASCVDMNGQGIRVENPGAALFGEGDSGGPTFIYHSGGSKVALAGLSAIGYNYWSTGDCFGGSQWTKMDAFKAEALYNYGYEF